MTVLLCYLVVFTGVHKLYPPSHDSLTLSLSLSLQPRLDNVQSSLQRRSSSVAKVQAKINKLEDEVCKLVTVWNTVL